MVMPSRGRVIMGFVVGVLLLAGAAVLIAALVPERLAKLRESALAAPFRSIWIGFLGLSVLIGAGVLLAISVLGLLAAPAAVIAAIVAWLAGYVVGVYAFGVGLLQLAKRPSPTSLGERAIAALAGSLVASLIVLIPLLGWIFMIGLVLLGLGALLVEFLRPRFLGAEPA